MPDAMLERDAQVVSGSGQCVVLFFERTPSFGTNVGTNSWYLVFYSSLCNYPSLFKYMHRRDRGEGNLKLTVGGKNTNAGTERAKRKQRCSIRIICLTCALTIKDIFELPLALPPSPDPTPPAFPSLVWTKNTTYSSSAST